MSETPVSGPPPSVSVVIPVKNESGNIGPLVATRTPIFIYHSEDDYVRVEPDRLAAKRLQDTDLDFVYTELPDKGHAFPESIRHDLFAFLFAMLTRRTSHTSP